MKIKITATIMAIVAIVGIVVGSVNVATVTQADANTMIAMSDMWWDMDTDTKNTICQGDAIMADDYFVDSYAPSDWQDTGYDNARVAWNLIVTHDCGL